MNIFKFVASLMTLWVM